VIRVRAGWKPKQLQNRGSERMIAINRMAAFNSSGLRRIDAAFESAFEPAHFKGAKQ
jgi:hypothetical protein